MLVQFTEYQLEQFNNRKLFRKDMCNKLMSFYSHLCYTAVGGKLQMSISDIGDRWNNKHKKKARAEKVVSNVTIFNWVKKLLDANLLTVDKESDSIFIYTIIEENIFLDSEFNATFGEIFRTSAVPPSIEIAEIAEVESCDNSITGIDILDIDSNSGEPLLHPVDNSTLNLEKYNKKCTFVYAMNVMSKVFQELKVKSEFIKESVTKRIEQYYSTISESGAFNYMVASVRRAQAQSEANYRKHCLEVRQNNLNMQNRKASTFTDNCIQRDYSTEDFKAMERALNSWTTEGNNAP